jgi:hypothetical protein
MEEEEFEDVEWEEEVNWEREDLQETDSAQTPLQITISDPNSKAAKSEQPKKKKKVFISKYSERDYTKALNRRKDNFSALISKIKKIAEWSTDPEFLCILQSMLPTETIHELSKKTTFTLSDLSLLNNWLTETFEKLPSKDLTEEEGRDGSPPEDLIAFVLSNKVACNLQYVQLLHGLLNSFHIRSRIVCSVDPPLSLSPQEYDDLGDEETINYKKLKLKKGSKNIPPLYGWIELFVQDKKFETPKKKKGKQETTEVQVLNKDSLTFSEENRWMHYDGFQQLIDCPDLVEKNIRKNNSLSFVIGCENRTAIASSSSSGGENSDGFLFTDLTAKYKFLPLGKSPSTLKLKNNEALFLSWLERKLEEESTATTTLTSLPSFSLGNNFGTISSIDGSTVYDLSTASTLIDLTSEDSLPSILNSTATPPFAGHSFSSSSYSCSSSSFLHPSYSIQSVLQEEKYLEKQQLKRNETINLSNLPNTFQGFQNHPVYLLERFLKTTEILNPEKKKAVAIFKGETVYLQEHKEMLKSKLEWRRELRQVNTDEKPLKTTTRTVQIEDEGERSGYRREKKEKELYAKFQTSPLEVRIRLPFDLCLTSKITDSCRCR